MIQMYMGKRDTEELDLGQRVEADVDSLIQSLEPGKRLVLKPG